MIIVMEPHHTQHELNGVLDKIVQLGYKPHVITGEKRVVIGAVGDERGKARLQSLESMTGVEKVVPILQPFKLAGREVKKENSTVRVANTTIGGKEFIVIAGPCSVESREQILTTAKTVKENGAQILRGGAFKPRTSPYAFQGLAEEGLKLLAEAREITGLPIVTEVINPQDVALVGKYTDMFQVGARNMQNFPLLRNLGIQDKPVLLKRGMMSTVKEFLMSAEYILSEGNHNVVLCERGIRTFETATRFTLDLNAVPVLKKLSHLPILVDPSHGTGHWEYVIPMAKAAIAAGADGLIVEVHPHPEDAFSDGIQSLKPHTFMDMMNQIKPFIEVAGRTFTPIT